MKPISSVLLGLIFLIMLSCTPAPPGQVESPAGRTVSEEDFDPLAQDAERPIQIAPEEGDQGPTGLPGPQGDPIEDEDLTGPERPGVARGFRVQIFLSDDLREASRVMAEARDRFEQEVYLEYDAPYYKVRVGDCPTEWQGEELLRVARRMGYPDAWLVRTIISLPQEEETP